MPRPLTEEERQQRQTDAERVRFLLEKCWGGNQNRMGRDLQVSQSIVSKIARGERIPGKKIVLALSRHPGVNPDWVLRGEGQPFLTALKGNLPISRSILPGWPERYPELLTSEHHPVAEALERASRYWLSLAAGCLLVEKAGLALLPGDLLLCDADRTLWEPHVGSFTGHLFGVKLQRGTTLSYEVGLLREEENGLVIDLFGEIVRLLDAAAPAEPPPNRKKYTPSRPRRRKIRFPKKKDAGPPREEDLKQAQSTPDLPADKSSSLVCAVADLVSLLVYMVRDWSNPAGLSR